MANMTTTTGAVFVPEIWRPEVRAFLRKKLILGNRVKQINFRGSGDTIHIPNISELVANDKAANIDVQFQSPTDNEFTMQIQKHKEASFLIEDILRVQSATDLRVAYTSSAGYAIGRQMDTDLWDLADASFPGANKVIGGDGSTQWDPTANANSGNGTDLTDAGIRQMIQFLDDNDVPEENRVLAISPSQKNAMLAIPRFTEFQTYGSADPLHSGLFGEIYGVTVVYSNNASTIAATDTTTMYRVSLMFQKDAFVLAKQLDPRVQSDYMLEKLGHAVVIDSVYDVAIFRQTHAIAAYSPV